MSRTCPRCDWESGKDTEGPTMPMYLVADGTQGTHCPECKKLLDTCENTARPLGGKR